MLNIYVTKSYVARLMPPRKTFRKRVEHDNNEETTEDAVVDDGIGVSTSVVVSLNKMDNSEPTSAKKVIDNFDLLKNIVGYVRKPIDVYDETEEDLQCLAYHIGLLDWFKDVVNDSPRQYPKILEHIQRARDRLEPNRFNKYKHITPEERQKMYDFTEDTPYDDEIECDLEDYGIDLEFHKAGGGYEKTGDGEKIKRLKFMKKRHVIPGIVSWLEDTEFDEE